MKRTAFAHLLTLALFLFMGGHMLILAQDHKPIFIKPTKDDDHRKDRPRVPALYSGVMAEYDGSVLTITFDEPEGDVDITITDYYGEEIYSGSADTCAPISIMLGAISNPTEISVSTPAGNTYTGYLYAQ